MPGVQSGSVVISPRRLSSRWHRVPLWIVVVAFYAFLLVIAAQNHVVLLAMLIVTGLFGYLAYPFVDSAFKVLLDGSDLVISQGKKSVRAPVSAIRAVSESRWRSEKAITITFDRDYGFGQVIEFTPEYPVNLPWGGHPVLLELRRLAGLT